MNAADLREDLGVRPDPEFELDLPPGWTRSEPDEQTMEAMIAGTKRRLMQAHRPDLFAQMKTMMEKSFEDMRRNGVFAFFSATENDPDTLFVPASMNASILRADAGESLDDTIRSLVTTRGAQPLNGDKRTMRIESQRQQRMGTDTVVQHSLMYLTPIPGSKRRRALRLVAGFASAVDASADDLAVDSLTLLFDSCVSTLRWRAPSEV